MHQRSGHMPQTLLRGFGSLYTRLCKPGHERFALSHGIRSRTHAVRFTGYVHHPPCLVKIVNHQSGTSANIRRYGRSRFTNASCHVIT